MAKIVDMKVDRVSGGELMVGQIQQNIFATKNFDIFEVFKRKFLQLLPPSSKELLKSFTLLPFQKQSHKMSA